MTRNLTPEEWGQAQRLISNTIGFDFSVDNTQAVNASDLLNLYSAIASHVDAVRIGNTVQIEHQPLFLTAADCMIPFEAYARGQRWNLLKANYNSLQDYARRPRITYAHCGTEDRWVAWQLAVSNASCTPAEFRSHFEVWLVGVAKIILASNDPYVSGLEREAWLLWQAARDVYRQEPDDSPELLPNCEALSRSHYVVRTQAGFRKALKLWGEGELNVKEVRGYPKEYPALVAFGLGYNGAHFAFTQVLPLNAVRDYLKKEKANANPDEDTVWAVYDAQGIYSIKATEEEAKGFCTHYNRRQNDPLQPYTYKALSPRYASPELNAGQQKILSTPLCYVKAAATLPGLGGWAVAERGANAYPMYGEGQLLSMLIDEVKRKALTDPIIESVALKHEAFGFGQVDSRGLTTHGFDPDGLRAFITELLTCFDDATGKDAS